MTENGDKLHEARFLSLVLSLHGSAWVAMGKVANPMTGKVEKDLDAARGSIDLLETLKVRTKGNLTKDEEKTLANALSVLQLNFVDELARDKEEAGKKSPSPKPPSQEGQAAPPDGGAPQRGEKPDAPKAESPRDRGAGAPPPGGA